MTKGAGIIFQLRRSVNSSFIKKSRSVLAVLVGQKTILVDWNLLKKSVTWRGSELQKRMSSSSAPNPYLLTAPAAERNKEPILATLKNLLPSDQRLQILEIASGTGQHVAHFARAFPQIQWQPTDVCDSSLRSIQEHIRVFGLTRNVRSPLMIDICKPPTEWPKTSLSSGNGEDGGFTFKRASLDAILCTNMIHITPWACTQGLFSTAGYLLKPGGLLITYGPYAVDGVITPQSNVNFDIGLRQQNPQWGVRDVQDLIGLGLSQQLEHQQTFDLPANNKILVFRKS